MLVSNNDEATLAEANRPPDVKIRPETPDTETDAVHGLALSPKDPLAHELASMLRPQSPSNEDEDDLPMLESNRPSLTTPQEPVMIMSSADEPVDRLSENVPEGELHVWVYEARQLAPSIPDAVYSEHGLSVRCGLLGAVQQSPCNISGNQSHPVWRPAQDGTRDGLGGHFAWALGQPEETGDGASAGVEASECKLEIDVVCGDRVVGSASVALEDLLLSSKARAFEEDASDGSGHKIIRLSPHWLPLAGNNAGLLQISIEFIPLPPHMMRESNKRVSVISTFTDLRESLPQNNNEEDPGQFDNKIKERARQRSARFEPRDLVEACQAVPWFDQRDDVPQQNDQVVSASNKVIVSRSGGVTMYIPTQGDNTPPKSRAGSPPLAPKSATSSFGRSGGDQEQLMDKQLWDLYYFGISDESPDSTKERDSDGFTHTMSDFPHDFSDSTNRSGMSMYSRHASTCASDVLAYNELIQDMESAMKSMKETTPPSSTTSNQEGVENEDQSQPEDTKTKSPASSPTPKLRLKIRRLSRPTLNLSKPLDRIHNFWNEAKARASNSSNGSNSPKDRSPESKSENSSSSNNASPVAFRSRCATPSPSKGKGVVLFDPESLPMRMPYQRSTSRDQVQEVTTKAERERRAVAAGPRRRSLPINSFYLQHRQEMLLQQQRRRSQRLQPEAQFVLQSSLLASVDPPLLSRARSDSLHSLTDVYLPKTGDMHGVQVTTNTSSSTDSSTIQGAPSRATARRHSGSNVVYINGAPLCVGKFINVGNVPGVVRYIGTTRFATGTWVGIELCEQKGKNSGTVDGEKYFSCAPNHGIFIRASRLDLSVQ
ncbi:Dynactin subunit 1 [Phytophthora megakarya]|uniref:Dynactin subunit 1 n=1 Tax=Phytophthora megakarya TaxID=4795 RepID=A0A225WZW8_9STRA|nr:Dynactin subunit 1 [Phytophthora megakarya]